MKLQQLKLGMLLTAYFFCVAPISAQTKVGNLQIVKPMVRATLPGQSMSSGYVTIENKGSTPDRLIAATFAKAKEVQIHEMKMDGDKMMMRQVTGLDVPANGMLELKPGGYHLMLIGLDGAIKEGEQIKINLQFEKAGKVEVTFPSQVVSGKKMH